MVVLLVRHADAVGKEEFSGKDAERPLTPAGAEKAQRGGLRIAQLYGAAGHILSSPAIRARQTADLLAASLGAVVEETPRLAPGSTFDEFRELVGEYWNEEKPLVLVGHEPDFSAMVAQVVGDGAAAVKVGKVSCVELQVRKTGRGELRALVPYRALCG